MMGKNDNLRNDQKKNLKRKIRLIMKERRMRYIEESGIERRKLPKQDSL